ncbi:MAG: glycerophosphodiester phosphodiesterase family protein [Pseudomonadota bacterium]
MTPLPKTFLRGHIAHRGLHDKNDGRPENSIPAFQAAIAGGIAIELDVQPSSDGQAMAFHDYDLGRLTGRNGPVNARSQAELENIPLIGDSQGVPTLRDALDVIAGQVPVLIEIKDQDGDMGPNVGPLEQAVIDALDGYVGDVAVMSFNPHAIAYFHAHAPHIPRGLVTSAYEARHWPELSDATRARLRDIPDLDSVGAAFVSHQGDALMMPRIAEIKERGLPVLCWTVRSKEQERMALTIADAVTFEGYVP